MKKVLSIVSALIGWVLCIFFLLAGIVYIADMGAFGAFFLAAALLFCPLFRKKVPLRKKVWIPASIALCLAGFIAIGATYEPPEQPQNVLDSERTEDVRQVQDESSDNDSRLMPVITPDPEPELEPRLQPKSDPKLAEPEPKLEQELKSEPAPEQESEPKLEPKQEPISELENSSVIKTPVKPTPTIKTPKKKPLDEFFLTIGTDVSRDSIKDIANSMGLFIDYRNSGTGIFTYRIAAEEEVASTIYREKGSCVTVSFNGLRNNALTEITYFDEERMIFGYWNPDTGYSMADYNYPQIVYHNEGDDKSYSSQVPVENAKAIIEYSVDTEPSENYLEILFASVTPKTTKEDLLAFVDKHGLSYNRSGAGNNKVIAYCYNVGAKYGENGSYITFSEDKNGLITQMTYIYYPQYYRNGYRISFYSNAYAEYYSTPAGYVFESGNDYTRYQSPEELLEKLHNSSRATLKTESSPKPADAVTPTAAPAPETKPEQTSAPNPKTTSAPEAAPEPEPSTSKPSSGSGNGDNFNTWDNASQQQTSASWVLNTSSKKIHYPTCSQVKKIAPKNYATSNSSEASLIAQGYSVCKVCH